MSETLFNSSHPPNIQAPTSQQQADKAKILNDLCQFHLTKLQNLQSFLDLIETPLKTFVKSNKEFYNEYLNVWYLFSQIEDFFKEMRRITRELQENVRGQNISGPFTSWPLSVASVTSEFLIFFHNYHVYFESFKYIREEYPEFDDFLTECETKFGESISDFFSSYLELIEQLQNFYKRFCSCVVPQSHDFKQVQDILDITANALQKSSASLSDGIPNKERTFLFAPIKKHERFGTICEAYNPETNERFKAHIISKTSERSQAAMEQIHVCLEATTKTKCPNILAVLHFFEDELFYYMLYPFTEEMELSKILERGGKLPEEAARPIFRQLMHAIQHIHSKGVVHGDITPDKIVIYNNRVRLFDFTNCHFANNGEKKAVLPPSLHYASPDSLKYRVFDGFAADIWAAGIILYEMMTAKHLFRGATDEIVANKIIRAAVVFPKEFSPSVISLLRGILQPLPADRLPIEQILSHPWMKKTLEVTVKNTISATPPVSPSISPLVTRPVSPFH